MYEYTYPLKFEGDEAPRSELTLSSKGSNYESEIDASQVNSIAKTVMQASSEMSRCLLIAEYYINVK